MIWLLYAAVPGVLLGIELWCRWELAKNADQSNKPE